MLVSVTFIKSANTHIYASLSTSLVFPGGSVVKNLPAMQEMRRWGFDPWVRKIPWRMKWQPTPEEPGKIQSMGSKKSPIRERLNNNKIYLILLISYWCHEVKNLFVKKWYRNQPNSGWLLKTRFWGSISIPSKEHPLLKAAPSYLGGPQVTLCN